MNLLLALLFLTVPGLLPALAIVGVTPQAVFLPLLLGASLAAFAAVGELVVGGSIATWYIGWVVAAQVLSILALWNKRRARRDIAPVPGEHGGSRRKGGSIRLWEVMATVLIVAVALVPLSALKARLVGYDAHYIWVLHGIFISGGHHQLLADLKNPVYLFTNVDYPPLLPAASALGFFVVGRVDYGVAVAITAVLNASALGLLASGFTQIGRRLGTTRARISVSIVAAALCWAGFGIAGSFAVNGYADLLWAAAATAAVVYGLVLPRSKTNVLVAEVGALVAALTKNEGLVAALIILALVSLRHFSGDPSTLRRWFRVVTTMVVLAIPTLIWAVAIRLEGLKRNVAGPAAAQSHGFRLASSISGLSAFLHIVPAALFVLMLGAILLRATRRWAGIGNPAWLWIALFVWLAALLSTYTFGSFEIAWWIRTSAERTAIFPQLLLCSELAIWAVLAIEPRRPQSPGSNAEPPRLQ